MKWFIIGLIALGVILIVIGNNETNNRAQSADVRVGGSLLIVIGAGCIILALLIAFGVFLWMV